MGKFKVIIIQYFDKLAIGLAISLLSYSLFTLFTNLQKEDLIKKIEEFSPIIERNISHGKPPETVPLDYAMKLGKMFTDIPSPLPIETKQPYEPIDTKKQGLVTRDELQTDHDRLTPGSQEMFEPGDTEIVYKGGTPEKAIIVIRKTSPEIGIEQSFIMLPGEKIGENNPINGKKQTDFMTGCTLLDIVTDAKKTLNANKMLVNLNDKGEFAGTAIKSDPYEITTMKIVYKNDRLFGDIKELLLGSTANIGTITYLLEPEQVTPDEETEGRFWQPIQKTIDKIIK